MRDWNVIVTVAEHRFKMACDQLSPLGLVKRTQYYNVLAVKVPDISEFMETLREWMAKYPDTAESIARVAPVSEAFDFQTADEFEVRAQQCLAKFVTQLAGRRFHVRVHRRGWKDKLHHHNQEQFLGGQLLEEVEKKCGAAAEVDFDDPDCILAVETLDNRAGAALWSRQDLRRYPFLKLD